MIRTLILSLAFAGLAVTPSLAGFNLMCSSGDSVDVDFPLGGAVGYSVMGATIKIGERTWTTDETVTGATYIAAFQSTRIDDRIYIDLADPNYERVVARVRLFEAFGHDEPVIAGFLEVVDFGAFTVTCDVG